VFALNIFFVVNKEFFQRYRKDIFYFASDGLHHLNAACVLLQYVSLCCKLFASFYTVCSKAHVSVFFGTVIFLMQFYQFVLSKM